jgi:indolepyruvate ferredoxin oxidoreductase beta subunit
MLPPKEGHAPILSLMPAQGEVDVVVAAELMEAGRSILRGLVTPDRSTLIASTHRLYAVAEKEKPGDAIADPKVVMEGANFAAKRVIAFDMEVLANRNNSVISACLFGALAGSGVLPFERESFEAVIKAGGKRSPQISALVRRIRRPRKRRVPRAQPSPCDQARKRFASLPTFAGHPSLTVSWPHPRISAAAAQYSVHWRQAADRFPGPRLRQRVPRPADEALRTRPRQRRRDQGLRADQCRRQIRRGGDVL